MAASLSARLQRLEATAGSDTAPLVLLFLPAGVETGSPEADQLAAEHRERTRCVAVVVLSTEDAAL